MPVHATDWFEYKEVIEITILKWLLNCFVKSKGYRWKGSRSVSLKKLKVKVLCNLTLTLYYKKIRRKNQKMLFFCSVKRNVRKKKKKKPLKEQRKTLTLLISIAYVYKTVPFDLYIAIQRKVVYLVLSSIKASHFFSS